MPKHIHRQQHTRVLLPYVVGWTVLFVHGKPLPADDVAVAIGKLTAYNHDEIDQRPDSETAQRQELYNARAGFAYIESVHTETSEKEAK